MAMSYEKDDNSQLLSSHEERLSRLESTSGEILTGIATNAQKTEHLAQRLNEGFEAMGDKIESCVAPLSQKIENHLVECGKKQEVLDKVVEDVSTLEAANKSKAEARAKIAKIATALGLAIFGAFAKVFFDIVMHR